MFLQIGDEAINLDHVTSVSFDEETGSVGIYYAVEERANMVLLGSEAEAFKNWWNEKADVYKLPV